MLRDVLVVDGIADAKTATIAEMKGTAVTKNGNSSYITGAGAYKTNIEQSTTNNIYGIYDTVGGAYEYTAGYVADSSRSHGNSFASTDGTKNNKTESTQYATVYAKADSDSYTENYTVNINKVFGDGIIETSTAGRGTTSWYSASSSFVGLYGGYDCPFFVRGGNYNNTDAGSFNFNNNNGNSNSNNGFRVCLAIWHISIRYIYSRINIEYQCHTR